MSGLVTVVDDAQLILEPKRGWAMRGLYRLRGYTTLIILWGIFASSLSLFGVLAVVLLLLVAVGLLKLAGHHRAGDEDRHSFVDGISQTAADADAYELDGEGEESEVEGLRPSMEEDGLRDKAFVPLLQLSRPHGHSGRQESLQQPPSSSLPFSSLIEGMERRAAS